MESSSNPSLLLAKISFDGRNFQDAYEKYSKIIESNINNCEAWVGKGLAAGFLSTGDKCTLDESKICLEYAKKLGLTYEQKDLITSNVLVISKNYIRELVNKAKSIASDKGKQPTTTFELSAVKSVRNTADRYEANNEIFDNVLKGVIFSRKTDEFDGGIDCKKEQVNIIDKFFSEINNELHEGKKQI